jgi:hypothetical protein
MWHLLFGSVPKDDRHPDSFQEKCLYVQVFDSSLAARELRVIQQPGAIASL